ncbi:uncharacterized protein SCHCODRAFT_01096993 [Schizophyllum commune H4-8]|nr:uncharacterized protein SCHCODRAFT_01096993 [Schizophyllum commune H4-8]KAI5891523.1 hypothetical protein SCHCODRAFT_01096993 [Schizophyllum commune H4-8]
MAPLGHAVSLPPAMYFPQEIFDHIVDFCDQASLLPLLLTSRRLHSRVVRRLYSSVRYHPSIHTNFMASPHVFRHTTALQVDAPFTTPIPVMDNVVQMWWRPLLSGPSLLTTLNSLPALRRLRVDDPLRTSGAVLRVVSSLPPSLEVLSLVVESAHMYSLNPTAHKGRLHNLSTLCIRFMRAYQYSPVTMLYFANVAPNVTHVSFPSGLLVCAMRHSTAVLKSCTSLHAGLVPIQGYGESDRIVLLRTTSALSREAAPLFFASIHIASTASIDLLSKALDRGQLDSSWPRRLQIIHLPVRLPYFDNVTTIRWIVRHCDSRTFSPVALRAALSGFPSLVSLALHNGPRTSSELSLVLSPLARRLHTLELAFPPSFLVATTLRPHFLVLRNLIFGDGHPCDLGALFAEMWEDRSSIERLRIPAFCTWDVLRNVLRFVAPTLRRLDVDVLTSVEMYTFFSVPAMARLSSVRFEIRHPWDDSRRELSFVQDFMWIMRSTQERSFPALTTIDLHVGLTVDSDDTCDDDLLSSLTPKEMFSLARTCAIMHSKVQNYLRRAFNIDAALERFIPQDKISTFRDMQHSTDAIISGSFALRFLGRYDWEVNDLDLYVEERCVEEVRDCLVDIGYRYRARADQVRDFDAELDRSLSRADDDHYPIDALKAAFNFHMGKRTIQLLVTGSAVLDVVLRFHSTAVMNVITHSTAYALYPETTFHERRSLWMRPLCESEKLQVAYEKYEDRGFRMVQSIHRSEAADAACELGKRFRWIGDAMTWVLPLPATGDFPIEYEDKEDHAKYRSWRLQYHKRTTADGDVLLVPSMHTCVLSAHPVSRHAYDVTGMTFAYPSMRVEFKALARDHTSHPSYWLPKDCDFIGRHVCEGMSLRRQSMPAYRPAPKTKKTVPLSKRIPSFATRLEGYQRALRMRGMVS